MSFVGELLVSLLLLIAAFFALVGSIGLVRLPDFFTRLHAPTKSSTLGIGALLLTSVLLPLSGGYLPALAQLLLTFFVFITAPLSVNMLSIAALRQSNNKG